MGVFDGGNFLFGVGGHLGTSFRKRGVDWRTVETESVLPVELGSFEGRYSVNGVAGVLFVLLSILE